MLDEAGDPLKVSTIAGTGDRKCKVCSFIEYIPGPIGKVGVAYKSTEALDLRDAQRIVFLARGELGGETVSFVAIGKSSNTDAQAVPPNLFSNLDFAVISKNVTLTNNWARYELSLNGSGTTGVTGPFGFIVSKIKNQLCVSTLNNSPNLQFSGAIANHIAFFLKNVTLYSNHAVNPISVSYSNSSTTGTPYSENTTAPYSENTTAPYSENTTAPYSENTTAPYSENTTAPYSENTTAPYSENTATIHKAATTTTPYNIRLSKSAAPSSTSTNNKAFTLTRENATSSIQP